MKWFNVFSISLFLLVNPVISLAIHSKPVGLGLVAENMLQPLIALSHLVSTASITVGVCCLFAAFIKYLQHRNNPLMSPLGTIWLLLLMAAILILLPLAYKLTEGGVPY